LFGAEDASTESTAAQGATDPAGGSSVASAYRVIDEYVREGRRFAENLWTPTTGGDFGDGSLLLDRFVRTAADFTSVWFDVVQALGGTNGVKGGKGPPGAFDVGRVSERSESMPDGAVYRLPVAIRSQQLAKVDVDWLRVPGDGALTAGPLQPGDGALGPAVEAKVVAGQEGGRVLEIRVPDNQPAGMYHGVLVDGATRRPCAAVTLELGG
jgi:hypothetical protein